MSSDSPQRPDFGNEPPLVADRRRRPDRRQVSARWLAGTLLTGLTSTALMGIALSAALDGHRNMASPAAATSHPLGEGAFSEKGERVFATAIPMTRSRQTLELSTMTREGDREVIRTLPFAYVNMALASRHVTNVAYPSFDALKVFADGEDEAEGEADPTQIYGAKVESEISLKVAPFAFDGMTPSAEIGDDEAEVLVRAASPTLTYEPVQVASLVPVDPFRFATESDVPEYEPGSAFRVIQENVSVAAPDDIEAMALYNEELIPFRKEMKIVEALADAGYDETEAAYASETLADVISSKVLKAGDVIRVGAESEGGVRRIVRLSVYRGDDHVVTVAENDAGVFEPGAAPDLSRSVADAFDENATEAPRRGDMPTVYDGIYQAALSYGLNERLCQQLIRMLASEVDYQARLDPDDRLTVFYSLEEGNETATDASEILFVEAKFGTVVKKYYRFRGEADDHSDFYDEEGRSSRQFLLRNPVPNARMTSSFSTGRKHPVLGYVRPHWGTDWAAPRGTPILSSGSGTIVSAGWESGYGRQVVIRHANGYLTSYSHQSGFARGIRAGARVRQGQIIGYVGSTGLSTGNHLHYEVTVNDKKVDPMRIKLPSGRVLAGAELDVFKRERQRIDDLLKDRDDPTRVAGN